MKYKLIKGKCNNEAHHINMCDVCGDKPITFLEAWSVFYPLFGSKSQIFLCKKCYLKFHTCRKNTGGIKRKMIKYCYRCNELFNSPTRRTRICSDCNLRNKTTNIISSKEYLIDTILRTKNWRYGRYNKGVKNE